MDLTLFFILLGFALCNFVGLGLWIHEYKQEPHDVVWYKDWKFWVWFFYVLILGTAYAVLRLILYIKSLF